MKQYKNYFCCHINTVHQALEIQKICLIKNLLPIFFIDYKIINKLGSDWIISFNQILINEIKKKKFKIFIDCRKNYGLFIDLVNKEIDYLKVVGDKETLLRLKSISDKKKVTMNPNFNIINMLKIKKIELKINDYFVRGAL